MPESPLSGGQPYPYSQRPSRVVWQLEGPGSSRLEHHEHPPTERVALRPELEAGARQHGAVPVVTAGMVRACVRTHAAYRCDTTVIEERGEEGEAEAAPGTRLTCGRSSWEARSTNGRASISLRSSTTAGPGASSCRAASAFHDVQVLSLAVWASTRGRGALAIDLE